MYNKYTITIKNALRLSRSLKNNWVFLKFSLCLIIFCFGVLLPTASGYTSPGLDDREELKLFMDEVIAAQLEEHHIPGAALSIVKDGEVLLARGYGYANLDERTPVDGDHSLFRIGSLSKLFAWTSIMQLVEQGKLDLDADVNNYIDFEIPAELYKTSGSDVQPITLRHLMTHTPGFEDVLDGLFFLSADEMNPLGEHLEKYLPARVYPAGEVVAYSNYGAALAGYIVEQVSGKPFAEYVEDNIFNPLGMQHSTFRQPLPDQLAPHMVQGYKHVDGSYHQGSFEYIPLYPAGSMSSTATDMARFMLAHLQEGRYGEGQILTKNTVQEMQRQQFTHHPKLPGMTFGFVEHEMNGEKLITHNGATMLFYNYLYLIPEHNLGFFISHNGGDFMQGMHLFQAFMDRYFPPPPAEELPSPPADARERARDYPGEYHTTRMSFTTPDRIIGLMQSLYINMEETGYLTANFQGEPLKFVEEEPGLYQNAESGGIQPVSKVAFETGPQGRPLLAVGAATYIKAPWYGTLLFAGSLFSISFLLITVTLLGWTTASLWRLVRGIKSDVPREAQIARTAAVLFSLFTITYIAGIIFIFTDIDPAYGAPKIIFGIVTPFMNFIFALPWVLLFLSSAMIVFTVLAWKNSYWTRAGRLHYSLLAAGSSGIIWILSFLNML